MRPTDLRHVCRSISLARTDRGSKKDPLCCDPFPSSPPTSSPKSKLLQHSPLSLQLVSGSRLLIDHPTMRYAYCAYPKMQLNKWQHPSVKSISRKGAQPLCLHLLAFVFFSIFILFFTNETDFMLNCKLQFQINC